MLGSPTITVKGRNLLAKIVADNIPLTLSNIGLGDGLQEENEEVTILANEIMKKEIESCKYSEKEGQYYIRRVFTNADLEEGFYIREVGIYAIDPDEGEILYAYTNAGENGVDYFAPGKGKVIVKEIIEMATKFGNAENITVVIDPSIALVSEKEFEEYKNSNKVNTDNLQKQVTKNTTDLKDLANPSLLINGDFRNPVNQRRKSSYNVNGEYTIDRWRFINDNNGTMTINDGYISISNGVANNTYLQYNYDTDMKVLEGEKVTFTIVYKSTATYRLSSFIGSAEEDVNIYLTPIDDWTVKTLTLDLSSWKYSIGKVESSIILQSYDGSSFTNGTLDVKYIKLELGSVATPFVPRPYGEELALCQRYYYRWGNERARYRAVGINGNQLFFFVPLPTTLRIIPTINNAFSINTLSGAGVSDFTFAVNIVPMGMIVHATKSTHGMSDGQLMLSDDGSLDAEIY